MLCIILKVLLKVKVYSMEKPDPNRSTKTVKWFGLVCCWEKKNDIPGKNIEKFW